MTTRAAHSSDRVDGLRTLELGAALNWLTEQLVKRLPGGTRTISTVGARSNDEQEIAGMMQILVVLYPLAIELALKSLKKHLDASGEYSHIHKLDDLFSSLTENAKDLNEAQKVMDEARDTWKKCQRDGFVVYTGSIDEFLEEHRNDFVSTRYYDWSSLSDTPQKDFLACYFSILTPLITRDLDVQANFISLTTPDMSVSISLESNALERPRPALNVARKQHIEAE